jgi:hypothetical protein
MDREAVCDIDRVSRRKPTHRLPKRSASRSRDERRCERSRKDVIHPECGTEAALRPGYANEGE